MSVDAHRRQAENSQLVPVGKVPALGVVPRSMHGWTIRMSRHGEPRKAMQQEVLPVPVPGPGEVLGQVMAAGVNYNGVWASTGTPISVFYFHGHDTHVAGSDAAGVVWGVGPGVDDCRVGDEVVLHCNYKNYLVWGYETPHGSFAQFCLVSAQQVLPKPAHLSWEEAASYGLTYFSAYRMLITQAALKAGENVLVWGAAGGLGVFAIQLCRLVGARAIGVVSNAERGEFIKGLGAHGYIDRREFPELAYRDGQTSTQRMQHVRAVKAFQARFSALTGDPGGPDVVFEHVGKETFPTSVLIANPRGRIVICGATTGYDLTFDVRHLWMHQKRILGSHFATPEDCRDANRLVKRGDIKPVMTQVFPYSEIPEAHHRMQKNQLYGTVACLVGAPRPGLKNLDETRAAMGQG